MLFKRMGYPQIMRDGEGGGGGGGDPWYKGADAETVGHIQTKGWDKKTPNEVALEAIKSHREAEKFVGAPANELVRLPKDAADAAGWKGVWQRLGAPADPKDYDFSTVEAKDAAGKVTNQAFVDSMRAVAAELNLPKDTASRVAAAVVKQRNDADSAVAADRAALLVEEKKKLAENWGTGDKFEANKFVSRRGAAALGITPEAIAAMEGQVGYAAVMEAMRKVGAMTKEDGFVENKAPGGGGTMTKEQAIARKKELMADDAWVKRKLDGDTTANREMTALNTLIAGTE